jgi:hypothetical protein
MVLYRKQLPFMVSLEILMLDIFLLKTALKFGSRLVPLILNNLTVFKLKKSYIYVRIPIKMIRYRRKLSSDWF